ncbi:hypothetical protein EXIGLDRAFT_26612 [Exidia glandulosa HHB12029]|uniref:Uncharacterized protein n=1 Tax=Exidia glandulosa HHB12029 TaxID=1314781 RepID=A0A165P7R4_EXIGL|nr:hypothetical protein EXIGLDRAFT_26612 [Exidia glandulosa HHB12029]
MRQCLFSALTGWRTGGRHSEEQEMHGTAGQGPKTPYALWGPCLAVARKCRIKQRRTRTTVRTRLEVRIADAFPSLQTRGEPRIHKSVHTAGSARVTVCSPNANLQNAPTTPEQRRVSTVVGRRRKRKGG